MEGIHYKTSSDLIDKLRAAGCDADFVFRDGRLFCAQTAQFLIPTDLKIMEVYRFEGPSNPDDMSVVYVLETGDRRRGLVVDAFGIYGDRKLEEFLSQVPDSRYKAELR